MPKTASQMSTVVKRNIGGRENGFVGTSSVDDMILDAINDTIMSIVKRQSDLPELQRDVTFQILDTDCTYDIPTEDVDGNTISIKNVAKFSCVIPGSTVLFTLRYMFQSRFDTAFQHRFSAIKKRPAYYSLFANKIQLDTYPNQTYDCYLRVNIWPTKLTVNQTHPLTDNFDDVIEAGAVARTFLALQQTEDANYWEQVFEERLQESLYAIREQPDYVPSRGPDVRSPVTDPALDPFVKRM